MTGSYHRTARCQIHQTDSLAKGDIPAAVGLMLLHCEVIKQGIATVASLGVEGKERHARALEGNKLVAQQNLFTQGLESSTIE